MNIAEKLTAVAENQQKVFDAGFKSHTERHMQNCDKNYGYANAFSGYGWCDDTYNPTRPIKNGGTYNNMFAYSNITDTKVDIDCSLTRLNRSGLFTYANKLKTIKKLIVTELQSYTNCFNNCTALENITFEGIIGNSIDFQWSTLLSRESIENIVSCLSAESADKTLTLSETAVNNAFTTDEWNTLIADKTNWTFSLM